MSLPLITMNNVSDFESISQGHPVYRIRINNVDYSLKGETAPSAGASSEIKWANKIMHNVGGGKKTEEAKIRLLEEREIDVIALIYDKYNLTGLQKILLEDALTVAVNVWYLMHFQPHLLTPSDNMNATQIDQLFNIVNHGSFWKKLGKIIAVDLFTGNNDRFDFGGYDLGATPQDFWSNPGNLFVNVANLNNATPMGLDFFYNTGAFGKDPGADRAYIKAMKSKHEISLIADLIIDSIMDVLTGKNLGEKTQKKSKFKSAFTSKIKGHTSTADKYRVYLTDSIWEGLAEIKRYLVNKRNQYARTTPPPVRPATAAQRFIPHVVNNRQAQGRAGSTVPLEHNNMPVAKGVVPQFVEDRMQALNWI